MKSLRTILSIALLFGAVIAIVVVVVVFRARFRSTGEDLGVADYVLAGQALTDTGAPIRGYALVNGLAGREGQSARINSQGQFFFSGLTEGHYTVTVVGEDRLVYTTSRFEGQSVEVGRNRPNFINLSGLIPSSSGSSPAP